MMRSRSRAQGGFTLIEILLTIAIAGIILAPVGSWMILTLTSHVETAGRFSGAAQTRLLETFIQRDVSSAEIINDGSIPPPPALTDCAGGDGKNLVLGLWYLGTEARRVVYKVAEVLSENEPALVRVECGLGGGNPKQQTIVHGLSGPLPPVAPLPVSAVCSDVDPANPDLENPCKKVTVDATLASGATLHTEATRRGSRAFLTGIGGTTIPYASIGIVDVKPRTRTTPYEVTVSAEVLYHGHPHEELTFAWSSSNGNPPTSQSPPSGSDPATATFTFSNPGDVQVFLKVTDKQGNSDTASRTIPLVNRAPIVRSVSITLDPGTTVGIEGFTTYTFTAVVEDPDSNVANVEWLIPDFDITAGGPNSLTVSGKFQLNPFPEGSVDYRAVALAVRDAEGGEGSWSADIQVHRGGESYTIFEPVAPDTGQTPPLINAEVPQGMSGASLILTPSNPAVFVRWEMVKPGDPGNIWTEDSEVWNYALPLSSASGQYTIRQVTIVGDVEDTVYINMPPEVTIGIDFPSSPSLPADLKFNDRSVDSNGSVESVLWDFGALGTFNGPSATVRFTDPGEYTYKQIVTDNHGGVRTVTRGIRCTISGCVSFDV